MNISDGESINLENAISILNSEGEKSTPYTLTIKNICDTEADYQVNLETLNVSDKLADQYVTLKVNSEENKILNTYEETTGIIKDRVSAYKLYEGHLKKNQVMNFEIRMWIGEEVEATEEVMNKLFQSKVTVEATVNNKDEEYKEDILNGTDPVLKENLIPVTIDDKGNVYKADTKSAWYNYADKKWANAVILEDGITKPEVGEKIEESEIESYFVWIPKYSYQLWDLGNYNGLTEIDETKPHTIPIRFGLDDTTDDKVGECETPMNADKTQGLSGETGSCNVGDYMTHPAFISFGANGLWVGKFETGYKDADTKEGAQVNPIDETDAVLKASKVIIKPNVYSWRGISPSNAYLASYNYERELDSHMMKNTEWGVVAFLSHSNFGTCTNGVCNEVRINNSQNYVTGVAAKVEPTTGYDAYKDYGVVTPGSNANENNNFKGAFNYNNKASIVASTTGNYTGIYDMSGGAWDYVAAVFTNVDNPTSIDQIVFGENELSANDIPSLSYIDLYATGIPLQYNRRILGDATAEMGPFIRVSYGNQQRNIGSWYEDDARFVDSSGPWFIRGGQNNHGIVSGIFNFHANETARDYISFRIVLAPQKS